MTSQLSKDLTKKLDKKIKKEEGIYFTPISIIKKTLDRIYEIPNITIKTVLEPSCGSGDFIKALDERNEETEIEITGIEQNKTIFDEIDQTLKSSCKNSVKLYHKDYLQWENEDEQTDGYDLIIGNPPYFVVSKSSVSSDYQDVVDGRPNIFILFIIHSLYKLSENGILAFVLPRNFTNCIYYSKMRKYIYEKYEIVDILDCKENDDFADTKQDTLVFIIRKAEERDNSRFAISRNDDIYLHAPEHVKKINELYKGATSLDEMGFDVKVGTVVWNQHKEKLTDDETQTRLIYSGDIKDNRLEQAKYRDEKKKNYIMKEGHTEPILVINRGYGKGQYVFNYCLIEDEKPYLIENHLICINHKHGLTKKKLQNQYKKIIKSFENKKTTEFIELFFGNNAINTTEMRHVLPMYK